MKKLKGFSDGSAMWRGWRTTGLLKAKRVYVGESDGNRSVGGLRYHCLKRGGLDVRQARRMVHDWSVWRVFVKGNARGDEPLTLTRCYSCEMSPPYEALEGLKSVCGQAHNLRA